MTVKQDNSSTSFDISANDAFAGLVWPEGERVDVESLKIGLPGPPEWSEIAYVSMCNRRGGAVSLEVVASQRVELEENGSIFFTDPPSYVGLPEPNRLMAKFKVPAAGRYSYAVRLQRSLPGVIGSCSFRINQTDLGDIAISPQSAVYTFVSELMAGEHIFHLDQRQVGFWFFGLKVFTTPILSP